MTNAQGFVRSEKYPIAGIYSENANGTYSKTIEEIVCCYWYLAEDNNLQPYFTKEAILTSKNYTNGALVIKRYFFDKWHQQGYSSLAAWKAKFTFRLEKITAKTLIG